MKPIKPTTMKTYTLTKTPKGKQYLYEIKDENGAVLATRTSARAYVAATADGKFFFGRKDLIGKGEHGRAMNYALMCRNYDKKAWEKDRRDMLLLEGPRVTAIYYKPESMEMDIAEKRAFGEERWADLNAIAYLDECRPRWSDNMAKRMEE